MALKPHLVLDVLCEETLLLAMLLEPRLVLGGFVEAARLWIRANWRVPLPVVATEPSGESAVITTLAPSRATGVKAVLLPAVDTEAALFLAMSREGVNLLDAVPEVTLDPDAISEAVSVPDVASDTALLLPAILEIAPFQDLVPEVALESISDKDIEEASSKSPVARRRELGSPA